MFLVAGYVILNTNFGSGEIASAPESRLPNANLTELGSEIIAQYSDRFYREYYG